MAQPARPIVLARRCVPALVAVLAWLALLATTAALHEDDLESWPHTRRFWEDLSVAASIHLDTVDPNPDLTPVSIASWEGQAQIEKYQTHAQRAAASQGIRSWQAWRTIRMARFHGRSRLVERPSDDTGRSRLLAFGFRVLGGVAPFLELWLGALIVLPVLVWTAWDLARAERRWAMGVILLGVGFSPFVAGVLSLPYAAMGFYVIALLALVPLAVSAFFDSGRLGPFALRTAACGMLFALCVACRSNAMCLLPGFLLALAWAAAKRPGSRPTRAGRAAALIALFVTPLVVFAPRHRHETWLGLWEGLGDFDRTKGHAWEDRAAKQALRDSGVDAPAERFLGATATAHEIHFRELVVADVLSDPAWFAGILLRRTAATLTLEKLWPSARATGRPLRLRSSPNEGSMDTYWTLAPTVDHVGVGAWRWELPAPLLVAPLAATLLLAAAWVLRRGVRQACGRLGPELGVVACVAVAALGSPVLVTTASGVEPQAFALVGLVCGGFLFDLTLRLRDSTRGRSLPARDVAAAERALV